MRGRADVAAGALPAERATTAPQGDRLVFRAAREADLEGLYRLATGAGQGMTNLPRDRGALAGRVAAGRAALQSEAARMQGPPMLFVVDAPPGVRATGDAGDGMVGTACVFARIGMRAPFYSYRITPQVHASETLGKRLSHDVLVLTNDFDGSAEVGGLFVDAAVRGMAAGRMTARARYLFMAEHRDWFGRQVISELRGWQDDDGRSPLWEALGRQFYDMEFAEADYANGLFGNQFISDLAPKHPIYTNLLAPAAREALGRPHRDGHRARDMLLDEGFRHQGHVDIFDGGPTFVAEIDDLKAIRDSRTSQIAAIAAPPPSVRAIEGDRLVSAGRGVDFRAARGALAVGEGGRATLEPALAAALGVVEGDTVRHVVF